MTQHNQNDADNILLAALGGTNPLGFLAALGALRALSAKDVNVRMSWCQADGVLCPLLTGLNVPSTDIGRELHGAIALLENFVWSLDKKLPFATARFRDAASMAIARATIDDRDTIDMIAALGAESLRDPDGDFHATSFCMVRSGDAAGQGLLAYGKRILESTTAEQLQQAVSSQWTHDDDQCALRWDPVEDRGYALQWRNPSKVGAMSTKGGNCLALLGLALFPTAPCAAKAETVGFGLRRPKQLSFSWPIWKYPIDINVARSLLSLSELQEERPNLSALERCGLSAVYRCERIMTSVYYANFTPSRRVA